MKRNDLAATLAQTHALLQRRAMSLVVLTGRERHRVNAMAQGPSAACPAGASLVRRMILPQPAVHGWGKCQQAKRAVDLSLVARNGLLGYGIVAFEQNGEDRAARLKAAGVPGCSDTNRRNFRRFHEMFSIQQTMSAELALALTPTTQTRARLL